MKKKTSECFSCRLAKVSFDKLDEICRDVGLTKTKVVEKAIDKFYESYKKTGKV